jgi:acetyl-CoA decarbonylase/synthase complex subunit gamma
MPCSLKLKACKKTSKKFGERIMALSGIQIYKLLPQTNCKECGFPTCLAFAMKLAAKQVELAACPYVSEESKSQLAESAAPPIRLVALKSNGYEVKAGNEVVLFRHEKTFYNRPGIFIQVKDSETDEVISARVSAADAYAVSYVGIELSVSGFAVKAESGDAARFAQVVKLVRQHTHKPLILAAEGPAAAAAGLQALPVGEMALLHAARVENWEQMADLAMQHKAALAIEAASVDTIAELVEKIKAKGLEDLVLDAGSGSLGEQLTFATLVRRLALKKNFRTVGYPMIAFPKTVAAATQAVAKYAGFIVLEEFKPELVYPLLVLRENIYTDPQKPIQVQPGVYEINSPNADSPLLVTTNFSITYFSVANEVEGSGLPAWLVVCDADVRADRMGGR